MHGITMTREEIEDKIRELEEKLKEKSRERGEVASEGGGRHDNSALDLINEEISVLEARIRELKRES